MPDPSREGSVVLEIGGTLGALIIHTGLAEEGLEIEVSPTEDGTTRTHAAVRPRHLGGHTSHCAVISPLPEGGYTLWRTADTPEATVVVRGGEVTEYRWK
ncbi:phospholipase [Streptomyces tateyamensis]|uniref:Phospholipase n=1 Tax=Streptomyces tateyamensis TaxID=565073 RepID=A0A2V4P8E8_9ACTN|nr:phospholipase [Streptomyces tateyamensis]